MHGLKEHFLIILLFLVLVLIFTVPFALHSGSAVISGHVDNLLNVWITSWDNHALATNPTNLFQANINYASPDSLAYSEHLFIVALLSAPIGWIAHNQVLAYNLISLIGFALAGYTMYLLVKYLTHNRLAALAAGAFFAFVPYHFSTIVHVHVSLFLLQPLLLLFLFRYFDEGRPRYLVGLGIAFLAQALLSWYQVAFSSIPIGLFLIWQLLSRHRREKARYFAYTIAVLALCMVLVIPFALPYFRVHENTPESESRPSINAISSARASDYLRVLPQNWLYSKLGFFNTGNPGEGNSLFPGFLIFPLALIALVGVFLAWKRKRGGAKAAAEGDADVAEGSAGEPAPILAGGAPERAPPEPRAEPEFEPAASYFIYFLILGAISFLLALGPSPHGINNVFYRALNKLPFYGFVRFPIRYHILVILALSVVVGYACTYVFGFLRKRKAGAWPYAALAGIIVLMLLEFAVVNLPYQPVAVGNAVPQVYRDLKDIDGAVVVELPLPYVGNSVVYEDPLTLNFATLDNTFLSAIREQDSVYYSTFHWKKLVNGLSGYYPLFYRRTVVESQSFPSRRSLDYLESAGVTNVVMHWDQLPASERDPVRVALGASPGVKLVRDYPQDGISLYQLPPLDSEPLEAMDVSLYLPRSAEPGAPLNASLVLSNPGEQPFMNLNEARQHLKVDWLDAEGRAVSRETSYFYAPFFIERGQSAVGAFELKAPPAGSYRLRVSATDGILKGESWEQDIVVEEARSTQTVSDLEGTLQPEGPQRDISLEPGDVFSIPLALHNTSAAEWERQNAQIAGSVVITAVWTREDDPAYNLQEQGMLPGDVSAGQEAVFPIELQAPREAGSYTLTLSLNCLGVTYIGQPLQLKASVPRAEYQVLPAQ